MGPNVSPRPSRTGLVAVLAGLGAVAGSYAAAGFTGGYVVAPLDALLQRAMPGVVVTAAIETLGSLGQALNLATATVLAVLGFAALARLALSTGRRADSTVAPVVLTALLSSTTALALTGAFVPAAAAGLGSGGVLGVAAAARRTARADADDPSRDRRELLAALAGAAGIGSLSLLGRGLPIPEHHAATPDEDAATVSADVADALETARERSLDVEGIEPLVSRNFYTVDINSVDPQVDPGSWSLSVTGAVDEELTFDLADLRAMDSRNEFVTLRCVGESRNGHKLDTALWTGVDPMALIERAGVASDCECVMLRAADDYYEEFPLAAFEGGLLAYEMNGASLPRSHGFPIRALVPGHWGEVNVKWLTEIELLDRERTGFWEERGWHGTGPVTTVAKLHAVNRLEDGRVQVAGHAYAGTRGVSVVEVSTDGGDTWRSARLSEPLPGEDVWRQWAHTYDPPGGAHEVVVRAAEDDGTVQPREQRDSYPNGATGWVSRTVE
ncbi:MAG: molybdopterin-dependent oxidoreductase [Haloarculaceae archaeon]